MTTFRPDSPVLTLWPGHSCRAPLHGLTIFLSHSHRLVLTLERSVSNNPKLPWPHQTPLLTLGSLFVLFFFSHKLRKTWDPRSWWRYSPLPLGLEPSPLIPHLYRNAEFLHKVLPYQPAWDFPSLLPSVLGWSFFFPLPVPSSLKTGVLSGCLFLSPCSHFTPRKVTSIVGGGNDEAQGWKRTVAAPIP